MAEPSYNRRIEIFIGCRSLDGYEETSRDFFAVINRRDKKSDEFEEVGRTETIYHCDSPQFCTSFELSYEESLAASTSVRVDVYQRRTLDTERLKDHAHLGKVTTTIHDIMAAAGYQVTTQLSHPVEEKKVGIITLCAESIDVDNPENDSDVQLDITAVILRKKDMKKTIYGQRYELRRAHINEDCEGHTVWLPVYKSDRISKQRDSNSKIEFSSTSIRYRHLCNGDEERRIRITMYAVPQTSKKTSSEICLGNAEFTLRDLCELDPTSEVLQLERVTTGEVEEIGHLSIMKAEPTDFGSHFALQVNYDDTERYTAASVGEKRGHVTAKTIRKKLSIQSLPRRLSMNGRSSSTNSKKTLVVSSVDGLFSNSFTSPELP